VWGCGVKGSAKKPYEKVNNPRHYNSHPSGVECIDVIEHMTFNSGTALKYLWRAGLKPGEETVEDLKKALWYVGREIKKVTKELETARAAKPKRKRR
jgi:hypothetical protein